MWTRLFRMFSSKIHLAERCKYQRDVWDRFVLAGSMDAKRAGQHNMIHIQASQNIELALKITSVGIFISPRMTDFECLAYVNVVSVEQPNAENQLEKYSKPEERKPGQ